MRNDNDLGIGIVWFLLTLLLTIIPLIGSISWAIWKTLG